MHYDGRPQVEQVGTNMDANVTEITPISQTREARKAAHVRALQKAAEMNPDEFWLWWFSLPKAERRALLDVVAMEKEAV
jgi:hypothetical protein